MTTQVTVLVTGFEPFGRDTFNPSLELARRLHKRSIGPAIVLGAQLPVVFEETSRRMVEALKCVHPDIVISFGLDSTRSTLCVERVAINLRDGGPDNRGVTQDERPIIAGSPSAYFATLPCKTIARQLSSKGIPAKVSNAAGTFCCNEAMYAALHHIATYELEIMSGFIHVPRLPVQAFRRGRTGSLDLGIMLRGAETVVQVAAQCLIQSGQRRFRPRIARESLLQAPMLFS